MAEPTLQELRWAKARVRLARMGTLMNHPRRLAALYLVHARGARLAAAGDRHPGRAWWIRQALGSLAAVRRLRP